jgi:hypothetical protein
MFSAFSMEFADHHFVYLCNNCNQCFAVDWNIRANYLNSWICRGSYVCCPYCGAVHQKRIGCGSRDEFIPYKAKLTVTTYKSAVVLKVNYEAISFKGKIFRRGWCKGSEVIKFDIESAKTTFYKEIRSANGSMEFTTYPVNRIFASGILNGSVLKFFRSNCLANSQHRSQLTLALKLMREEIRYKIRKFKGIDVGALYINAFGHDFGAFLLPVLNMANRLECLESVNYTRDTKFKEILQDVYTMPLTDKIPEDWLEKVVKYRLEDTDLATSLVLSAGLPNTPQVRRLVLDNFKCIINLKYAFEVCKKHDLAIRLHQAIQVEDKMLIFFDFVKKIYGELGLVQYLETEDNNLMDCIMLYDHLSEESKTIVKENRVRIRELHDFMSFTHKRQTHTNINLAVPEHITKRLSMQLDKIKFIVPQESIELLEIGIKLNNCVASYSESVQAGRKQIVAVADDKGKLVACLEIRDNTIVQAKINQNKQVRLDNEVNQKILVWARKTKLKINTYDINTEQLDKRFAEAV